MVHLHKYLRHSDSWQNKLFCVWPIIVIVGQNIVIFQNHYFNDFGFPWDFSQGYYALVAFWTTLVSQGIYPSWVPYHSMGMPIDLLLQSAIHYPPLWIFPILKIEYSLHAAVVFQCLHVLFGGVGMYLFLLSILKDCRYARAYALLGGFLFQLFGGFYSNSEHVDIIRAFAFTPWLFYIFLIPYSLDIRATRKYFLIPIILLLLFTGAYPGNIISSFFILGAFYIFQLVNLFLNKVSISSLSTYSGIVFFMVLIGLGLSANYLGPSLLYKNYLLRSDQLGALPYLALKIEHLPAFFLDNSLVPGEISMTSTYLTLPALILVSLIPTRLIKEHWPVFGVLLVSLLMIAGPGSFVWFFLSKFVETFQYSRFPISDFRVFIAITLIYFAVLSTKSLVEDGISWSNLMVRFGFIALWFSQGVYVSYPALRSTPVYQVIAVFFLTISILLIHKTFKNKLWNNGVFLIALFIIVSIDAYRVLPKMGTWQLQGMSSHYKLFGWHLEVNGKLATYDLIEDIPNQRPARVSKDSYMDYSWEGFITGQYTLLDFKSPNMLKGSTIILEEPVFRDYMLDEWTPLLIKSYPEADSTNNINVSPDQFENIIKHQLDSSTGSIQQTEYGINEIRYKVDLSQKVLMVENEAYFPGWKARLISDQNDKEIQAISVNNIFRAWVLPPGRYEMESSFIFPFDTTYKTISIVSLLVLVLFGISSIRSH